MTMFGFSDGLRALANAKPSLLLKPLVNGLTTPKVIALASRVALCSPAGSVFKEVGGDILSKR